MADKLLRHIPSGVIYIDQPAFSTRPDFEPYEPPAEGEVAADAVVDAAPAVKKKKTKAELAAEADKAVQDALAEAAAADEALSEQASRGL